MPSRTIRGKSMRMSSERMKKGVAKMVKAEKKMGKGYTKCS